MKTIVWLAEGTWEACVDAARELSGEDAEITLLHVRDPEMGEALRGAHLGLLGRTGSGPDPVAAMEQAAAAAQEALLNAAADRLGRPAARDARSGRAEQEVVGASQGAGLLIMARDGDHTRLGPRSIGPASRFVLDHAACRVLLVWPDEPPGLATMPRPPGHPRGARPGGGGPGGPLHDPGGPGGVDAPRRGPDGPRHGLANSGGPDVVPAAPRRRGAESPGE